jgi:hypothetical protein
MEIQLGIMTDFPYGTNIPGAEKNRARLDAIVEGYRTTLSKDSVGKYIHNECNYESAKKALMDLGFGAGDAARWLAPKQDQYANTKKGNTLFRHSIVL